MSEFAGLGDLTFPESPPPVTSWRDECRRIAREARRPRLYVEVARCCPGKYPPLDHRECCGDA
jgi:hypothetical protein